MFAYKTTFVALMVGAAVLVAPACQKQNQSNGGQVRSYSNDGYLGLTDVNPNLPTSPTYHTYGDDTRLMREVIKQIPDVRSSSLTINGPDASVKLKLNSGLTDAQMEAVRMDAYNQLATMMPRYRIHVSVYR
ncbi:hypothetical protein [Paenibacillus thalictri]|uniref:Sporulation protein n=1 Tax=Paenibacillus thalictri TaxID=2527873 RepID=A0A4Q9DL48_9BACL|nr:hypothetical protein [Paenibacillus thalictri]TBL72617.1 hypothetical protein EYB31_28045 [Paenibacillus thalictri]